MMGVETTEDAVDYLSVPSNCFHTGLHFLHRSYALKRFHCSSAVQLFENGAQALVGHQVLAEDGHKLFP